MKRESVQLVVDKKYTVSDTSRAMDVGLSMMTKWCRQLRDGQNAKSLTDNAYTSLSLEINLMRLAF